MNKLYITKNRYGYWQWHLGSTQGKATLTAGKAREEATKWADEHNIVLSWSSTGLSAQWWLKSVTKVS